MSNPSKNSESVRGLPLSPSMRSLLGAIISLIDRRILAIEEARLWAQDEEPTMVPVTCDTCSGTGLLLIEPESNVKSEAEDAASSGEFVAGGSMDPAPGFSPSPVTSDTEEMMAYLGIAGPPAVTGIAESSSAGSTAAPASGVGAPVGTSTLVAPPPMVPTATPTITSNVVSVPPADTSNVLAAPANIASTAAAPVNIASTAAAPTMANGVPQPSVIIAGFHSLGESTSPPKPEDAVFCTEADGPPFYTVTRGKRVGCFGRWDMVSPYVIKAGGVVYRKWPSLIAAYEAYIKAYNRGAVAYT